MKQVTDKLKNIQQENESYHDKNNTLIRQNRLYQLKIKDLTENIQKEFEMKENTKPKENNPKKYLEIIKELKFKIKSQQELISLLNVNLKKGGKHWTIYDEM